MSLAAENQITYELLASGNEVPNYEGIRGDELDKALVDKEQALVTNLIDEFFIFNFELTVHREKIMSLLSYNFNPESPLYSANLPQITDAIKIEFTDKGETLDMSNETHRKRLGYALIDNINFNRTLFSPQQ